MARAQRHYIPEQIWHITHRCHKREFLLKKWVDDHLGSGNHIRDEKWTESIAVGSKAFVDRVKGLMGFWR